MFRYFNCACPRCQDPSELGSNLNTILCQQCRLDRGQKEFILPPPVEPATTAGAAAAAAEARRAWRCEACAWLITELKVKALVQNFGDKIKALTGSDRLGVTE